MKENSIEEDLKVIWESINCEACYKEDIEICKKCECKCREYQAYEDLLEEINKKL